MAAWFTVYCTRSVAHVTADDLVARLRSIDDPWTVAETYGLDDDDAVDLALARLRIEPLRKPKGVKFAIRYKTAKSRPIHLHLWAEPKRVQTEREEALELLKDVRGRPVKSLRTRVANTAEVVALELGLGQLEDMGVMLAGQMAEFLGAEGAGPIRDPNDDWWGF